MSNKRILIEYICSYCNKPYLNRKSCNSKYCGKSCASLARLSTPKPQIKCEVCNAYFRRSPSKIKNSKSGLYFCSKDCKAVGQRLSSNLQALWPTHYGVGSELPSYLEVKLCVSCGETKQWRLCIHHIDGNNLNNFVENLEVVCANCHFDRHTKVIATGERIFHTKSLTPRDQLKNL